ncbi:DUF5343 domain-containing protein [Labrys sp. WJW]|uniref:DUF5343 domain-containing protein n=1 Tax=Labrys sp. WJW TaxID=1737983 RepID=UPI00138FED0D|nr:DUF5343 domain-containing protein [Labrys sp. WJW]
MPSHPYISGPGNVTQMIGFLRKNFPPTINSETVKKFSLAPNNESYVINALQFIGIIDEDGKRTEKGHDIFVLGDDAFSKSFGKLVKEAYKDLFDLRGEEAWTLGKNELVTYFRTTDKTSEIIGGRQAGLFQAFRALSGYEQTTEKAASNSISKAKPLKSKPSIQSQKKTKSAESNIAQPVSIASEPIVNPRSMAMTVRIEINLPANGTQEVYDSIFKSIRANLINE